MNNSKVSTASAFSNGFLMGFYCAGTVMRLPINHFIRLVGVAFCLLGCSPVIDKRQVISSSGIGVAFSAVVVGKTQVRDQSFDNSTFQEAGQSAGALVPAVLFGESVVIDVLELALDRFIGSATFFLVGEVESAVRTSRCLYFLSLDDQEIAKALESNVFFRSDTDFDISFDLSNIEGNPSTEVARQNSLERSNEDQMRIITASQVCNDQIYTGSSAVISSDGTSTTIHPVSGDDPSIESVYDALRNGSHKFAIQPTNTLQLNWIGCESRGCLLNTGSSRPPTVSGVMVVWREGDHPHAITVRAGNLEEIYAELFNDPNVLRHAKMSPLLFKWAELEAGRHNDVLRALNTKLQPFERNRATNFDLIEVNLPF